MNEQHPEPGLAELPRCFRHPDRETGARCNRCDRPICPDCLRPASVGYWCPECTAAANARMRTARAPYGGTAVGGALVTTVLVALNVAAYVLTAFSSPDGFLHNDSSTIFERLALWPPAIGGRHEYWRLGTSMFLHIGPWHLLVNMLALGMVGAQLEPVFGRGRYLALYLLAGLGGSVAVYLFGSPCTVTAGASGALFGLFGALLVVVRRLRYDARPILAVIVIILLITFTIPNISKLGHVGGLVTGVLAAVVIVYAPKGNRVVTQGVGLGLLAALLIGLVLRTGQPMCLIGG
ncbi:MAG TPA: rhomboid family intramembrane serine protease [Mycobacteriales bacterium]|nr:rhomboid family intramembrane serine protease [Mycobacteriales bacterium]